MKQFLAACLSCSLVLCFCCVAPSADTLVRDCSKCVIGIYDDPEMTATDGKWPENSPVKMLWIGIHHDPDLGLDGVSGLEISVDGLYQLPENAIVSFDVKHGPSVVLGNDIRSPPPTVGPEAQGGINAAWPGCISGNVVLVELQLFSVTPLTHAIELTVRRRFPAADPAAQSPLFTDCNDPIYEKILVPERSYTLGPVAVESETWGHIKRLYR